MNQVKLSARVRPNSEVAAWVHTEIQALENALAEQAREIERLQLTCNDLDDQNDRIYAELAALKSQPSGVVLPELQSPEDEWHSVMKDRATGWNACLREVARLNSSPVSDGERCMCGGSPHTGQCLYEHFLSYSGLTDQPLLRYAYFHGAGFAAEIDQPSAGGVDERAAFEDWAHRQWPGAERKQLERDDYGMYKNSIYRDFFTGWRARAALPANHGEQVRHMVPQMVDFSPVPDDFRSQANGYRAGWNDCRAAIAAAPSAGSQGGDV